METLIKIGQLLLSLSILIVLHELGHFVFARLFKTRVEKFYLFFNPWFSLFKVKKGETEYGIGWLPLGGYVKISGMIDESMDKEALKKPAQPYEFRSKPSWQRLLIMLGGVIMNLVLAFVIYSFILFAWGDTYLPTKNMEGGIWVTDSIINETIGLQTGDKIISIDNEHPERFTHVFRKMIKGETILVNRNGKDTLLNIPRDFAGILSTSKLKGAGGLISPRFPFVVAEFVDSSGNKNAGLLPKDRFIKINGIELKYFDQYKFALDTLRGKSAIFTVNRGTENLDFELSVNDKGQLGIYYAGLGELEKLGYITFKNINYSFLQSIPAGFNYAKFQLLEYIDDFKLILDFKSGAHKGLGGFGAIGKLFPATWDWHSFWTITAFLSIMLAFLNVLPIPALDGGHVAFLAYEMITGRKPGEKFLEYAQIVGMILLLFLVLYANGNDIYRWIMGL